MGSPKHRYNEGDIPFALRNNIRLYLANSRGKILKFDAATFDDLYRIYGRDSAIEKNTVEVLGFLPKYPNSSLKDNLKYIESSKSNYDPAFYEAAKKEAEKNK